MEDEDRNISPNAQKMDATEGDKTDGSSSARKSKNLVDATAHLKEEAIRRYRIAQEEENAKIKELAESEEPLDQEVPENTIPETNTLPYTGTKDLSTPAENPKSMADADKQKKAADSPSDDASSSNPTANLDSINSQDKGEDLAATTEKVDITTESQETNKDVVQEVPTDASPKEPEAAPQPEDVNSAETKPNGSAENKVESAPEETKTKDADKPTNDSDSKVAETDPSSKSDDQNPTVTAEKPGEETSQSTKVIEENKDGKIVENTADNPEDAQKDAEKTAEKSDEPSLNSVPETGADTLPQTAETKSDTLPETAVTKSDTMPENAESKSETVPENSETVETKTESGAAEINSETESGAAEIKLDTEPSSAETKIDTEPVSAETKPETESGTAETKSDTEPGTAETKPETETGTAETKPETETGTAETKPETEPGTAETKLETEPGTAETKSDVTAEKKGESVPETEKTAQAKDQGKGDQAVDKQISEESGDTTENGEATQGDGDFNENAAEEGEEGTGDQAGESKEKKEEAIMIPDDFYYNIEEHISKAEITEESGLPQDFLALKHSFGYDCKRRCNLHILDENHLLFMAGNVIQLLDITTRELTYIRSTSGGGIGALAVHPSRLYFAVGEKGNAPNINVFEYPSLKLFRILRGGTEQMYSSLNFSPDGELLASQGGEPDFMLTVWNWKQETIMLRTKAFSQEVFRVSFSSELEGQLTTAGTGHIRFWKMADTFTGLKLQGELGRFGKTEISDIEGYVELPDGKVLSGSEYGNMLLWEGGLIKVEICRKGKKLCHNGAIQQILLDEGELMTIGVDGNVRMWDFETIDTADSMDDTGSFEMEPMNELKVGSDVQLKYIVKSIDDENEATIWYAQDANGGIWKLDLSFSHTSLAPEKITSYHAGSIAGSVTSPVTHLVATTGEDATVRVYDYMAEKQVGDSKFAVGGTAIMWAPKIVDTKGSTVYVGFEDGVLRILNVTQPPVGIPGKKYKTDCEISLKQVLKPHKGPITCLAVDGKGEFLVTGGADNTVFFIGIGETYDPVGFVTTPAPVRQITFSPEKFSKSTLLVACENGIVVEYELPDNSKVDTAHSYHIQNLAQKQYQFRSIKSTLRHEEEMERKRIEDEIRKKKEEKERRIRIERGLETESDNGDEEESKEPEKPKEEWKPYIPDEPSPILQAFYSVTEGKFWLSMGEFDAGYLYECKFVSESDSNRLPPEVYDEPTKSLSVVDSLDVPISIIRFSNNGQQVLFGMQNGKIRIQQLDEPFDISTMAAYWMLSVHDNHYGNISGLCMSFDSTVLLTVGEDGNFFKFHYMEQLKLEEKILENKAKIPSARKEEDYERHVDDIDDPHAYSIEDAKQKAEYDKLMKQAEEKKREVRRSIAKLRRQFKAILEQNEELPSDLQLGRMEFEMDREIKLELQRQTEAKIEVVRKELAWESEKQRISLDKLRKRFKDVVECERIVLKCFQSPHELSCFRANKLSDDFYKLQASFERRKTVFTTRDDFTRDPTRDLLAGQTRMTESSVTMGEKSDDDKGAKVMTTLKGSMGERITKALQKVEEKKKKRAARRAQWAELHETKPDDNYEDPADVASIKEAKQNMGDYKLKTAQDYVVPDHLRMNVDKARGRLLLLKDLIHEYRYNFNIRFLALREKKIQTIEEITDLNIQLEDIHSRLDGMKHKPVPPVPTMSPDEQPEKKLEYTRETLLKFKKEKEQAELQKKTGGAESSGFGGGFGLGPDKHHTPSPPLIGKHSSMMSGLSKTESHQSAPDKDIIMIEEVEPSLLELQIKQMEEIRLVYEQDRLLKRIDELLKTFDAELKLLRHEKFKVDIVMKNADLRQVTLFEEFVLLKEYEIREENLADKVSSKHQEKLDMQTKIMEVQGKLDNKKKDIEKLQEKDKKLHADFLTSLGENNKFVDYLTKVFKKKIKRTKKKTTEGGDSNDDSDEDSDDESDWEESDEESESEVGGYDLDVCPPGCDQNIYDGTCQLREKRLDNEEELVDEKKNAEALKKELESLQKKAKVIDASLKYAQNDLEAFQLEKQQKLNELDVVVTLRLHQILHIVNGVLPQDLTQTLVFESSGVERLQHRIKELEHEKHLQKKQMKESRKKHVSLIKDRKVFEEKIGEMNETCNQMMIAKFGCIVDLEKIETVVVNRGIEEMKEKLRVVEIQCSEEMVDLTKLVADKKKKITELIRENTNRLEQLCMLSTEKKDLEGSLDSRQKNLGEEYSGQRKSDVHEKKRLIQLVQLQAQEVDALKEEIMLLSRKGGHILPPAQPPLPQTPTNIHSMNL